MSAQQGLRFLQPGDPPTLERREDGSVHALTPFPEVLEVSVELLRERGLVHWREDVQEVEFSLANGRWIYRVEKWTDGHAPVGVEGATTAVCSLISSFEARIP